VCSEISVNAENALIWHKHKQSSICTTHQFSCVGQEAEQAIFDKVNLLAELTELTRKQWQTNRPGT